MQTLPMLIFTQELTSVCVRVCVRTSLAEVWRCLPGRRLEGQRQSVTQQGNLMNEGRKRQGTHFYVELLNCDGSGGTINTFLCFVI